VILRHVVVLVTIAMLPLGVEAAVLIPPPGIRCADYTSRVTRPVAGQDFCYDAPANSLLGWNGRAWIGIPVGNYVNVKDLGAKGDGMTLDDGAFSAAVTIQAASAVGIQPSGGSLVGTALPIFVPPGIYQLSDHIVPTTAYSRFWGIGNPILRQTVDTKNILDFSHGYVVEVRGMSFIGGAKQIRFCNNNLDASKLLIEDVEFQRNISQPAVEFYLSCGAASNLSVIASIKKSKFIIPYQVVATVPGVSLRIEDTWAHAVNTGSTPPSMVDGPLLVNKGELILDRFYGVPPITGPSTNARWIDNYDSVKAIHSRFGAEGGGMPIVYQVGGTPPSAYPYMSGSGVHLLNSQVSMGPNGRANRGIVRFVNSIPQTIEIVGCSFAVQDSDRWISVDGAFDTASYIRKLNANTKIHVIAKKNQGWLPLHVFGYPSALVSTDPTKVYFEFDEPPALVNAVYAATTNIDPAAGRSHLIIPGNGNAFKIALSSGLPGGVYQTWAGQILTVTVKNTFGVLGSVSHGAGFKGTPWTAPANGFSRSKTFRYDGTQWIQISETTADVPN
jgi:Pectate lyase superfamily protein